MKQQLKTYLPTILPIAFTVAGVVAQTGKNYLAEHPHFTIGGLFGALALAVVNHWIKSPVQQS